MNEPRFFRSQRSDAQPPPAPSSRSTRIEIRINWEEKVTRAKKIRQSYFEAAAKARILRLKRSCWQEHGARLALDTEIAKIFASKPGSRAI